MCEAIYTCRIILPFPYTMLCLKGSWTLNLASGYFRQIHLLFLWCWPHSLIQFKMEIAELSLAPWSLDHVVPWPSGALALWSLGHLVPWPVSLWPFGPWPDVPLGFCTPAADRVLYVYVLCVYCKIYPNIFCGIFTYTACYADSHGNNDFEVI